MQYFGDSSWQLASRITRATYVSALTPPSVDVRSAEQQESLNNFRVSKQIFLVSLTSTGTAPTS